MKSRMCVVFVAGLVLLASAGTGAQGVKHLLPASLGDLNAAQLVEVRDDGGQVLLHGTLETKSNSPKETEREADLVSPTGQKSKGKAEIEIERTDAVATKDELKLEVEKLPAMVQLELFVDGKHVASFVTTKSGKASLKLERKAP